jgi:hypothetical protein
MLQAPWYLVHVCLIFILMVIDLGVTSLEIWAYSFLMTQYRICATVSDLHCFRGTER